MCEIVVSAVCWLVARTNETYRSSRESHRAAESQRAGAKSSAVQESGRNPRRTANSICSENLPRKLQGRARVSASLGVELSPHRLTLGSTTSQHTTRRGAGARKLVNGADALPALYYPTRHQAAPFPARDEANSQARGTEGREGRSEGAHQGRVTGGVGGRRGSASSRASRARVQARRRCRPGFSGLGQG